MDYEFEVVIRHNIKLPEHKTDRMTIYFDPNVFDIRLARGLFIGCDAFSMEYISRDIYENEVEDLTNKFKIAHTERKDLEKKNNELMKRIKYLELLKSLNEEKHDCLESHF